MRTLVAVAALGLLGGCFYDRPNPWNTEGDVEDLEERTQDDLQLAMREVWPEPQERPDPMLDPKLDAWSRTVLPSAERATLEVAEAQGKRKLAELDARIRSLMRHDELSRRETLTPLVFQYLIEKQRLKLLAERLSALGRA
jgi:hypothetical protein